LIVTGADSITYWATPRTQLKNQTSLFRSVLEKRAKIFRNAQHRVISDAGHMLHYDQPDETNAIVREFLFQG